MAYCVKPFNVLTGRQKEFTAKLLLAGAFRRLGEDAIKRQKRFLEMMKQVEGRPRPNALEAMPR
jgi:hypothetical protein